MNIDILERHSHFHFRELLAAGNFTLQPTQNKLCFPILQRIHYKMKIGVPFENINVHEGLLINGHHRYICSLLLKLTLNINPWSSPLQTTIYKWPEIQIEINDWESIEIIKRHNLRDAFASGLDIKAFEI